MFNIHSPEFIFWNSLCHHIKNKIWRKYIKNLPQGFVKQQEMAKFTIGATIKIFKSLLWPEKLVNISQHYTKRCRIWTFGGVCFLWKVDFVNNFRWKSWFKFFDVTIELYSNLKILYHDFLMKLLSKKIFCCHKLKTLSDGKILLKIKLNLKI